MAGDQALRPGMQSITVEVILRVICGTGGSARHDELRQHIVTLTGIGPSPFLLRAVSQRTSDLALSGLCLDAAVMLWWR